MIVFIALLPLCGCTGSPIANENNARLSYEKSVAAYRSCQATNEANQKACDGKRVAMEMEEHHWRTLSDQLHRTNDNTSTVTVQSR
jgi:hypothetical protein